MGQTLERMDPYTRALNKSHLIAAGFSYEELSKPIIGIANSWNEFNHGHARQREHALHIKNGVRAAGGLPIEFQTPGPCDGLAVGNPGMCFILPSRELITDVIEATIGAHPIFDGLVLLSSCDKITPGMLKAAARLKMPAIHIAGGPSIPAITFDESRALRKAFLQGEITEKELAEGNALLYSTHGNCAYIGTANTMNAITEALGMALPGSALAPAVSARRMVFCQETGVQIVKMVDLSLSTDQIFTRAAFENALRVAAALGGSSNYVLHILAIAESAGVPLTLDDIDEINRSTPLLTAIAPNGSQSVVDLDRAGGVPAVMRELIPLLDLDAMTINGERLGDWIETIPEGDREVIAPYQTPLGQEGGIVILKGNLAPQGAVVKRSAVPHELYQFEGLARVFQSEQACINYIRSGDVSDGEVLVVAYEGPRGGPGMREMHRLSGVVKALEITIAIVTDGRFSGADSGLMVGYVTPEAANRGPIGIVKNDDRIRIDLDKRSLDVLLAEEELAERLQNHQPMETTVDSVLLRRYQRSVGPATEGAIWGE